MLIVKYMSRRMCNLHIFDIVRQGRPCEVDVARALGTELL